MNISRRIMEKIITAPFIKFLKFMIEKGADPQALV
jgi:hypothetical protein